MTSTARRGPTSKTGPPGPFGRLGEGAGAMRERARPRLRRGRRSLRQALLARRRLVTAALAAAAVAAGLQVLTPEPPATVAVAVAARDLAAGHRLGDHDIRLARWPADLLPSGLAANPLGATLAAAMRGGEPITDARLHGAGLLVGQPPDVGSMAVWLAEPVTGLVRSGDRVDVLAGPPVAGVADGTGEAMATVVAESVLVLATGGPAGSPDQAARGGLFGDVDPTGAGTTAGVGGADLVVLAVEQSTALRLRAVSGARPLSVVVRASR